MHHPVPAMAGTKIKVKKKNAFNACGYVRVENNDHIISHGITGKGSASTPDQWLSTEDKLYDWVLRSSDTDWKEDMCRLRPRKAVPGLISWCTLSIDIHCLCI